PTSDLASYLYRAREAAAAAIDELRWPLPPRLSSAGFRDLFPTLDPPRPLQVAVEGCAAGIPADEPALVVIEAPTGEGKTEAAWLLADRWGIVGSARGVYVAMPTRATSDALFSRVRTILEARYAREDVSAVILQLLHGHAALSAEFTLLREMSRRSAPRELWDDAANEEATRAATVIAGDWFTYRKRGLLAPFGVGTVDQALLAALRVPHNFVRLFGLAGRVVVFDEVHAYDAYMLALFERLVEWLAALRASVVILSATLPQQRLEALVTAFRRGLGQPGNESSPPRARYPRITIVTRAARSSIPVEASALAQRTLTLEAIPLAPDREGFAVLGERLSEAVAEGGCAAVICNTVRQAQECYRVFRDFITGTADDSAPVLDLLHARAPFVWRQEREFRALRRFGKPGGVVIRADGARESVRRPSCAVLVATQIVEQSLDLDFDLLVTLPAPIDLLLQRAGRLHRHQRDRRPGPLAHPRLWCFGPPLDDEKLPIFDRGTLSVYDEHILLRTWITLQVRD
ncbi:MAG: CRISPR-associated helicase Cas3', partial [Thermomicrobium sp.]|nr:CRISPR-associated helicase Cas3' [Thermomicrobium sp.]